MKALIEQTNESIIQLAKNVAWASTEFGTDKLITTDKGLNQYEIQILMVEGNRVNPYTVRMWSAENPVKDIPAGSVLNFKDLAVSFGTFGKENRKYWNLVATSVKQV